MDLTTLNLSAEQMTALEGHITEITTGATQKETDKVRTEYSKKIKAVEDELVKYKPVTKTEGELALDARLKALEDKEKEITLKEKTLNITKKLEEQGLPPQLGKYMVGVEDVETEINSLKEIFNGNLIDNSFKPKNHSGSGDSITKEQFIKMSYAERVNLFKSNKDLFERLSK